MNEILTDEQLEALLNDSNAELSDGEDDEFSFLTGDFPVEPEANDEDKATVDETVDSSEELDDRNDPQDEILVPQHLPVRSMKWRKNEMPYSNPCESEIHLPDYEEERGIFESFLEYLPLTFWEEHAQQTNLYSVQKRQHKSVNTSEEEMLHLAGIHVVMGVLGYAQSKLYCQQDTQVTVIAKCMTRDRFYELRNYMHFVDNTSEHNEKLWKVKPFLDCVQKKCLTLPRSHHLSIDEQMVPFSGKCGFVTYVPLKPNPLGLKCFILAAPDGLHVLCWVRYCVS
ncbi:piggyBac transposable element-derived protein 3-like isoform X2 [Schistocerca cancellata]|nr:piggyBac transposable element-derived protein 3-like isoform X2 [Schistocerca cancellata]